MKKILIALAVLLAVQVADAQVKTPDAAKKALDKAIVASQDAKKATKVATWLKLATSYMDAYAAPAGAAWIGATKQDLALVMPGVQPLSTVQADLGGEPCVKEVYADKEFYFNQAGQLVLIYVTKPVVEDALWGAREAYVKAYEVDVKHTKVKDINEGLSNIARKLFDDGMNEYTLGNLKLSGELLAKAAEASATAPLSQIDTTALYNAGFIAWSLKDYNTAKKHFEACLAANYYYTDGEVFARLADIYSNLGDDAAAGQILEDGFVKFPQSQSILIGLINYYMTKSENPNRLFELVTLAKKNEPNNPSLPYVEGNIFVELRKADPENAETYVAKACEAYDACAVVNPEYEFGYIGKGIMFYNIAIELQEAAAAELDDAKWVKLNKQFTEALKNSLEPFEKAYNVSKGDKYEEGYNKYNEIVKTGVVK